MPDYTYYTEKYLGEDIPEAAFPRFARRAAEELARMQNIYPMAPCKGIEPDTAYAMAVCSIADAMYEFAQEDEARGLAKVSVGSVSETYTRTASAVRRHAGPAGGPLPSRSGLLLRDRTVAAPCVKTGSAARP